MQTIFGGNTMKKRSVILLILLALLVSVVFAGCSKDTERKNDRDRNSKKEPAATKATVVLCEEESETVGRWDVVYGYNATEGLIKQKDELSYTLVLNDDLTGSLSGDSKTYTFTWKYLGTNPAQYNPSTHYMEFDCTLDSDSPVPSGDPMDEFSFDIDTSDKDSIYLTFGNWLYLCKRS